jgi:tryptophan halogenase
MRGEAARRLVIVGGGTAGWMTAAAMAVVLDRRRWHIELVESDAIGIVGVGEATIPAIHDFNRKVGLDEQDFMRRTGATFKLGIEFVDWQRRGNRYMHPFGRFGFDINGVAFHNYWVRERQRGNTTPFDDYCLAIAAARGGRFALPQNDPRSVLSTYSYAFHFDASLYAEYLRGVAESRGVVRTEGRIVDVRLRPDDGHIESVALEDGGKVEGDLFIDCSGFRALLIGKALGVDYESWQHWLPCDTALAVPSRNPDAFDPYTRSTAQAAGWQWRIPLQHRTGNGHVFSSAHMDEAAARRILLDNLEREPLDEPRTIRFVAGRRREMWHKNCVAIGLSGGFLEPLESTSIYLIQAVIMKFIERFSGDRIDADEVADFNAQVARTFEQIRDFIILHYKATERDDSEFWNYCRNMPVPESLEYRVDTFRDSGYVVFDRRELFIETNWVAVMLGQGVVPRTTDLRVDCTPRTEVREQLQQMRAMIAKTAGLMPTHAQTLNHYCATQGA